MEKVIKRVDISVVEREADPHFGTFGITNETKKRTQSRDGLSKFSTVKRLKRVEHTIPKQLTINRVVRRSES